MLRSTPLLVTLLAAAVAVPAVASADHERAPMRRNAQLGVVGTHRHDAEDYMRVTSRERIERLELRVEGRPVRLDGIDVQYLDGRTFRVELADTVSSGAPLVIDVPSYSPIKMLVLDYDNPGRHWRAREDSRLEVRGVIADGERARDRDRREVRDRRDRRDRHGRDREVRPPVPPIEDARFQWRGGLYIRVGVGG